MQEDRYTVIAVNLKTGAPRQYGMYTGEDGADLAHDYAEKLRHENNVTAFVVGLH